MEEPIRILHVLTRMDYGGTETLLMNLYRKIDRTKIQFDFAVSTVSEAPYDKEIYSLGGHIYHYPRYIIKNHLAYCNWWEKFFENEGKQYKIVHGHICSTAAMYLSIAKKVGCYTIAHSHNTNAKMNIKEFLYRCYVRPVRYIADYFMGCSKQAIIDRFGENVEGKSMVLINGIDAKKYSYNQHCRIKMRNELKISDGTFVVGHVGRQTKQKNPFFILDVFECIKKRSPNSVLLYIGKGELHDQVVSVISSKGLENDVLLINETNHVESYMQAMDTFLFPSLWEGLGIVAIEAQASGLNVFASDTVQQEVNITSLVQYLSLKESPEVWAEIILNSDFKHRRNTYEQIVESGFDIEQTAQWLQSFYFDHYN